MLIGVPTEVKQDEHRVGLTPTSVRELTFHGHQVLVQSKAGAGIGMRDTDYERAGATIAGSASDVFARAEMIVKVKELLPAEFAMLRDGQVLFTYLHLAPDPKQTESLIKSGVVAIAYETVTGPNNSLP
ncbi:MAG: alanine dehydrogenase, partial [Gammaproteobacteria bacterium]